jgi:hypothetical protein
LKKVCLALVVIFFCSALCFSYTRITSSAGLTARWASMPIDYWTSKSGYSRIYNGSDVHQIREGFQKWQDVSTAAVSFNYRGVAETDTAAIDGINLVTFNDSATPLGTSAIAVTMLVLEAGEQNAVIREADIVFSSSYTFRTYWQWQGGYYDIQHIALHEIGHFLGLDHSPILAATMAPYGVYDNTDRNLKRDDIVGISEICPAGASGYGRIQGLASVGGQPRFGVHVAALDSSGRTVVSALTGRDGRYSLGLLQPGSYRIYAEPLDEPFTEDELGGSYYSGLMVDDFRTTFFGNTGILSTATSVMVSANTVATANIALLPRSNPFINLQAPAILQKISPNETYNINLAGADLTSGATFMSPISGLIIGTSFGTADEYPSAARVSVARGSNAPVGPADLIVTRGANTSIASGMLLVTDVLPTISQVSPSTGSTYGRGF